MLSQIFSRLLLSLILLNLQFSSIFSSQDFSPRILQKLVSEVRESQSEAMVEALSDLMTNANDDPRKMRREIVKLVRDPKFQRASNGRRTVKAIKLPTGIVQLLNAEISVTSKKEILDNVLGLLIKKGNLKDDKRNKKVLELKGENHIENALAEKPRKEKSFDEEPLATYSGSPSNSGDNYFGDIPGAGANFGLPSYQSQRPSDGGTNSRPNQSETSSQLGFSAGSSSSNSRPSGGRPGSTGNSIAGGSAGSRPSIGGGSTGSRPSFGGGSSGSRPSFGGGSSGSRPSFGGGSSGSGSRPGFVGGSGGSRPSFGGGPGSRPSSISGTSSTIGGSSSQETSEAIEQNNFGFPERLGKAGIDFPIYDRMNMPITSFTCQDKENGGYYADLETQCQLYHVCYEGKMFSELCPNGTMYNMAHFTCESWRRVDCTQEGLDSAVSLVKDFKAEQDFVTNDREVRDPQKDLPWRNRIVP